METSLKRIIAYIIDILIVSFVLTFFTSVLGLDPYVDEYNETYERYEEIMEEYDSEEEVEDDYLDEIMEINYDLNKYQVVSSVGQIILVILYLGVIQYFFDGQTLGKKLMKIKVVSNNDKKLNVGNYILRIIILNGILFSLINVVSVYFASVKAYYYITYATSILSSTISVIIILMIVLRNDARGLHDLCSNTKVIDLKAKPEEEQNKEEEIKELDTKEEKKEEKVSIKEKTNKNRSAKSKADSKTNSKTKTSNKTKTKE